MLYINPGTKQTFTAYQAMDRFDIVPMRLPLFSKAELNELCTYGGGQIVSKLLKLFFGITVSPKAIEQCFIHNSPIPDYLDRKTLLIKFNSVNLINEIIGLTGIELCLPDSWAYAAVKICLLFAIYEELERCGINDFDIALVSDELRSVLPACFAKKMGLPIHKIIVGSVFEDSIWKLLHNGKVGNTYSNFVGQLLFAYDPKAAEQYSFACNSGTIFEMSIEQRRRLSDHFFSAVVSTERSGELFTNLNKTFGKKVTASAAISYSALQDYRSVTGENITTIILMEDS